MIFIGNAALLATADQSRCYWEISLPGGPSWTEQGIPATVAFPTSGVYSVTFHYFTPQGCEKVVTEPCTAYVFPQCQIVPRGSQLCVTGLTSGFNFQWSTGSTDTCITPSLIIDHYTCTITHNSSNCTKTLDYYTTTFGGQTGCSTFVANAFTVTHCCYNKYTIHPDPTIVQSPYTLRIVQSGRTTLTHTGLTGDFDFFVPRSGTFTAYIEWDNGNGCRYCSSDEFTVSSVLRFEVTSDCQNIIVVQTE